MQDLNKATLLARLAEKQLSKDAIQYSQKLSATVEQASILIPIIDLPELTVLFTERTAHLKHHAGQISFPGGRREKIDKSLEATCLRETAEEIGIKAEYITILGKLSPLISSSGFVVTPFIGLINPAHTIQIDPFEVASVFTVPLNFLINRVNHQLQQYNHQGSATDIYVIEYEQYRIWGLTAKIIVNLTKELE